MRALLLALLAASGCTDAPSATPGVETGGVDVRTVRDDSTGIELPRVALAGRPAVEARVNASLDSLAASMQCDVVEGGPGRDGMSFEARTAVAHAADDVLSVSVHATYFCGGAYPTNDANLSVTYDLTTGEQVPFEALFRDYAADRIAINGVLQSTLVPVVSGNGDDECVEFFTTEAMQNMVFNYALGDAGVLVQPEFAHVVEACAVEATIPYASLRTFAAPGGPLDRVAAATIATP